MNQKNPKTEARDARWKIIKEMYENGALICDIADAVGYQPNTVDEALSKMGIDVQKRKPMKAIERTPQMTQVVVDGKVYWDITEFIISY